MITSKIAVSGVEPYPCYAYQRGAWWCILDQSQVDPQAEYEVSDTGVLALLEAEQNCEAMAFCLEDLPEYDDEIEEDDNAPF